MDLKHKFYIYGFDAFKTGHYFNPDHHRNNEEFHDVTAEAEILGSIAGLKNVFIY